MLQILSKSRLWSTFGLNCKSIILINKLLVVLNTHNSLREDRVLCVVTAGFMHVTQKNLLSAPKSLIHVVSHFLHYTIFTTTVNIVVQGYLSQSLPSGKHNFHVVSLSGVTLCHTDNLYL